jgi:glycosyltransferase involved in cell wall biosynthesis
MSLEGTGSATPGSSDKVAAGDVQLRVGVVVVAYNAASTLVKVLDRIPKDFRSRVEEVLVADDSSADATYLIGLGYREVAQDLALSVVRNPSNLGYGGNQKTGYCWAIEKGMDVVVLLHGDGQYAPEFLPEMVKPFEDSSVDAVFGSRMLTPGAARKGGMPLYKYLGNRLLTRIENWALGSSLSEFHSGYRAYRVSSLAKLDFQSYSDDFDFDTEIIIGMVDKAMHIYEIPIPTFYGDEICYVNGIKYAFQITKDALAYKAKRAFGSADVSSGPGYTFKTHPGSSHSRLLARVTDTKPLAIADIGCGTGLLSERLRAMGHHVTGVDKGTSDGVHERTDVFLEADLNQGIPGDLEGPFDLIVLADILEHLRHPEVLLEDLHGVLAPEGKVVVSVSNFAHWYPRVRVSAGAFGYDRRGILDEDHVRFFTRSTITRLLRSTGWKVTRREAIGVPWEELLGQESNIAALLGAMEKPGLFGMETLFAYQFLFEAVESPERGFSRKHQPREGSIISGVPLQDGWRETD